MKRRKLEKLVRFLEAMRNSPQPARPLKAMAAKLGRKLAVRGKEPNWISEQFSHLRPVSIPDHGGKDLPKGTRDSILNSFDEDVMAWEEWLAEQERALKLGAQK